MSRRARGTSLVEALVALLVMGLGMLATLGLQAHLRTSADEARHSLVAHQLAQQALDAAQADWAEGSPGAPPALNQTVVRDGAEFAVQREVSALDAGGWHIQVQVGWTGRQRAERVALHSVLGAGDPGLWAALAEGPADGNTTLGHPAGHAGVPVGATPLSPQRRFLQPSPASRWGWLLDARSGHITHTCEVTGTPDWARLREADAGLCTPQAQPSVLVSGHVRASLSGPGDDANDPVPDLGVRLTLASQGHLSPPVCAVQARGTVTEYHCAVLLRSPTPQDPEAYWSGRTELVGLPLGPGAYRVCRHTGDRNGNGHVDNDEHPEHYTRVRQSLKHQHFLVRRFELPCPSGVLPQGGELRHTHTQAHQP